MDIQSYETKNCVYFFLFLDKIVGKLLDKIVGKPASRVLACFKHSGPVTAVFNE
jgi:hypothetical protein